MKKILLGLALAALIIPCGLQAASGPAGLASADEIGIWLRRESGNSRGDFYRNPLNGASIRLRKQDELFEVISGQPALAPVKAFQRTVAAVYIKPSSTDVSIQTITGGAADLLSGNGYRPTELIIYNRELSSIEVQLLGRYFRAFYASNGCPQPGAYRKELTGIGTDGATMKASTDCGGLTLAEAPGAGRLNGTEAYIMVAHNGLPMAVREWYISPSQGVTGGAKLTFTLSNVPQLQAAAPGQLRLQFRNGESLEPVLLSIEPKVNNGVISFVLPKGFSGGLYSLTTAPANPTAAMDSMP